MNSLKPKLFTTIKGYSKGQLVKDVTAGVIVAIIALPLSIALALASGATPEQGLYTAIVAGFVISFLLPLLRPLLPFRSRDSRRQRCQDLRRRALDSKLRGSRRRSLRQAMLYARAH